MKRLLAAVALVVLGSAAGWYYGLAVASRQLSDRVQQQLVIYTSSIRMSVARYSYLPAVLSRDKELVALLRAPNDQHLVDLVNAKLEFVAASSDSSAVYLMDAQGLTLAADNWGSPKTFVGTSYSYRPYFIDALGHGSARYYGIGTTTNVPGLFLAQAVQDDDARTLGVIVVKVDLEPIETEWSRAGERILVADDAGMVFLTSEREWKYRPLRALSDATKERLQRARQYGENDFRPLILGEDDVRAANGSFVTIAGQGGGTRGILQTVPVGELGWTLSHFAELSLIHTQAGLASALTGALISAAVLGLAAASQRRRRLQVERQSRSLLEQRVTERTQELRETNTLLVSEIAERQRATAALQSAQDELVHAGKLATLGQVSSAITHEVNQPLAALQTYIASTQAFLARSDTQTVKENLGRMAELTDRISAIIRHLRVFSRKTKAGGLAEVRLLESVQAVLRLVQSRLGTEHVGVECEIDAAATVRADRVRLEQVILNLVVNALDAMNSSADRRLRLVSDRDASGGWHLSILDTGEGILEENMPHLFDPFFTTKEVGKGLGLGLSISSFIIREFGGTLSAANNESGGAAFSIAFPPCDPPNPAKVSE